MPLFVGCTGAGDAEAVEALLSEKYHEILRLRLGSDGAEAVKDANPAEVLQVSIHGCARVCPRRACQGKCVEARGVYVYI
eukprot:1160956-Pelagomonas_calceolata.AAC.1